MAILYYLSLSCRVTLLPVITVCNQLRCHKIIPDKFKEIKEVMFKTRAASFLNGFKNEVITRYPTKHQMEVIEASIM